MSTPSAQSRNNFNSPILRRQNGTSVIQRNTENSFSFLFSKGFNDIWKNNHPTTYNIVGTALAVVGMTAVLASYGAPIVAIFGIIGLVSYFIGCISTENDYICYGSLAQFSHATFAGLYVAATTTSTQHLL